MGSTAKPPSVAIVCPEAARFDPLARQCEALGCAVLGRLLWDEAVGSPDGEHPDLVLLDGRGRGAMEVGAATRRIREGWGSALLLLLPLEDREAAIQGRLAGATDIAGWPLDERELGWAIRQLLDRRRVETQWAWNRERFARLDGCVNQLGPDHGANIRQLTALCGELLGCAWSIYNRLEGRNLVAVSGWRLPAGLPPAVSAEGQICYDVLRQRREGLVVIPDLARSSYAQSDPKVLADGLRTYVASPVRSEGKAVGTLCALYRTDHQPTPEDAHLLCCIAAMVGNEDLRQRSEARVVQSDRMLRQVMDTIPQRVFWKDVNSVYLGCNRVFARDAGCASPDELVGLTDEQTPWKESASAYQADDRWVVEQGVPRLNYEEPQLRRDGRHWWLRTSKVPLRDADGRIIGVLGTYEDITETKRAQEDLRASEERYRRIVETAEEGILAADEEWRITFANARVGQLLDWPPGEMLGRHFFSFMDDEGRQLVLAYIAGRKQGSRESCEAKFLRRDGKELWALLSLSRISNAEGHFAGALAMVTDVTERKLLEGQLRHAQKMEAMGQLAGGVAHDFNNILTSFIMNVYLLKKGATLPAAAQGQLTDIENEARRAANLTRQLLLFSRRQAMQFRVLDLNATVGNLLKMLTRLLGEHIAIDFQRAAEPLWIEADEGMIEQVLTNLCVNARDAMPGGGRLTIQTLDTEVGRAALRLNPEARLGRFARLSVTDTGCGMSPAVLKRLFEPFFTTKAEGKGTGLGLATIYGIVKQHRGWVDVQSAVRKGSTFRVFLPSAVKAEDSLPAASVASKPLGGKETVLLVEDEPVVRQTVRVCLDGHGYRVLEARSGREALGLWERHRESIQLLFTDMVMPEGLSGLALAEQLQRERPELRVIIGSGYIEEMVRQGVPQRPHLSFLPKPYEPESLLAAIRKALDQ